jgi:hypothetical protein
VNAPDTSAGHQAPGKKQVLSNAALTTDDADAVEAERAGLDRPFKRQSAQHRFHK